MIWKLRENKELIYFMYLSFALYKILQLSLNSVFP
jgi:nitrate reductase NapE component